jgi:hypothetical protein
MDMMQPTKAPCLALAHFGNQREVSFSNDTELAEVVVPTTANIRQSAEKNWAA